MRAHPVAIGDWKTSCTRYTIRVCAVSKMNNTAICSGIGGAPGVLGGRTRYHGLRVEVLAPRYAGTLDTLGIVLQCCLGAVVKAGAH